jgi:hypothetical protein
MDGLIAAGLTIGAAVVAWVVQRVFVRPVDSHEKRIAQLEKRDAVRNHLLTQLILRIEDLEQNRLYRSKMSRQPFDEDDEVTG